DTATDVGPELDEADVTDANGRAVRFGTQADLLDVLDALEIASAADHVLAAGHLDDAAARLAVALANALDDAVDRDRVGKELVRVERHLVLLDEASHRGDFRDSRHGAQLI